MNVKLDPILKKRLFQIAWPLFIETALLLLIGSVDTVMVARYSNDASGAVGVANQIISIFNILFMIISVGSGILASQFIGAKMTGNVSKITMLSIFLNLIIGIISGAILFLFSRTFLGWLHLEGDLLEYGTTYAKIVGAASVFQAVSLSMSAIVRGYGHTKIAMKASLTANLVNVVLNYILIFGVDFLHIPSMGVAGAAIATLVSKAINFAILSRVLFRSVDPNLSIRLLRPFPRDLFRKMMRIGFPGVGENMSYNASQLVITSFVTTIGTVALKTKTFFGTISSFIYAFTLAIANATGVMVAQFTGEEKFDESDKITRFGLKWASIITVGATLGVALGIVPIMGLFTEDGEIIALVQKIVWIDFALELGRAMNILLGVALKSSGDVVFPVTMAVIVSWTIVIPLAFVFGILLSWGLLGIWIALAGDEMIRGFILLGRWWSKKWQNRSFVKN